MIEFLLNDQDISTDLPAGMAVLDFVRYRQNLKGTKIGCREGDCGACTILVGELVGDSVKYRSMTSCLMPLANAAGKHIVTIEGVNPEDGSLTPVQQAMVDESGTQCGFCTVGFVMSLTGFCLDETEKTPEMAVSAVDGNICRCTGYKSIERAASVVSSQLSDMSGQNRFTEKIEHAVESKIIPEYFADIQERLVDLRSPFLQTETQPTSVSSAPSFYVSGGTDVYVQRPDTIAEIPAEHVFYDENLRGIRDTGDHIEMGASTAVTDLLESPIIQSIFPDLYKHLKLVSSTPIRNMATLAGNFVNASPIGDMTVWFLALDAEITLSSPPYASEVDAASADGVVRHNVPLRNLYLGYKQLAKSDEEIITSIRFRKPSGDFRFNFEKVCKRTYLDIATVNTAISIRCSSPMPGTNIVPDFLRGELKKSFPPYEGEVDTFRGRGNSQSDLVYRIEEAHVAAGGVAPIPLYLKQTSRFLTGREVNAETISEANEIMQTEISPISDVRGTADYKRLLLRQLFTAHFVELFNL